METLSRHALPSRRDPLESADDSRIGGVLKSGIPPCHPFTDWVLHTARQHIEMGSLCYETSTYNHWSLDLRLFNHVGKIIYQDHCFHIQHVHCVDDIPTKKSLDHCSLDSLGGRSSHTTYPALHRTVLSNVKTNRKMMSKTWRCPMCVQKKNRKNIYTYLITNLNHRPLSIFLDVNLLKFQ